MKSNKINITFILPNLLPGGAERVFSYIAQNIDSNKFNASLLIIGYSKDASYDVKNVGLIFLEKSRVKNGIPALYKYIRKNKPDVLVSAIGHLNTVMGLMSPFFPKTKFIIREASVISTMSQINESNKSFSGKLLSVISHLSYQLVDKVICQSQDMANDFLKIYKISPQKTAVINNPITNSFPLKKINEPFDTCVKFITVGRLSKEKGHIRIIEMLSKLKFPFHYTIIGKGPLEEEIFNLVDKYNLNENITHIPFTKDVSYHMSLNDLFLQGSYVEGFTNTVLESCYVGTPVIAFNVPGGTKEIITHGINGYLVETEEDYLYYLNNRLVLYPKDVRNSVEMKFNKQKIISQYEALFN
jgi:glycosyltransferase involved in cell wall biosynthesis